MMLGELKKTEEILQLEELFFNCDSTICQQWNKEAYC